MENKKLDISKLDENKLVDLYIKRKQNVVPDTYFYVDRDSKARVHLSPWDYLASDGFETYFIEAKFFRDKIVNPLSVIKSLRPHQYETAVELVLKKIEYHMQVFYWRHNAIAFNFYYLSIENGTLVATPFQICRELKYNGQPIERDPNAPEKKKRKKKRTL